MQQLPRAILIFSALVVGYWVWPLHAALQIRDAMISGRYGNAHPQGRMEFGARLPEGIHEPEAAARLEADPNAPQPSLWQRIKSTVTPTVANTVIDRYVTPENLPVLLGYRRIWRGTVQPALGYPEPPTVLADTMFAGTADRPLRQLLEAAAARRHSLAARWWWKWKTSTTPAAATSAPSSSGAWSGSSPNSPSPGRLVAGDPIGNARIWEPALLAPCRLR